MDNNLLIIVLLAVAACGLLGYGLYLRANRRRAIIEERLETYATIEEEAARTAQAELRPSSQVPRLFRMVLGRAT